MCKKGLGGWRVCWRMAKKKNNTDVWVGKTTGRQQNNRTAGGKLFCARYTSAGNASVRMRRVLRTGRVFKDGVRCHQRYAIILRTRRARAPDGNILETIIFCKLLCIFFLRLNRWLVATRLGCRKTRIYCM